MWFSEPDAGGAVAASDGRTTYEVWQFGKKWECTCTAFRQFRKECKHISQVRDSIRAGSKKGEVCSFFSNKT
jgi:hypothetical protein